MAHDRNLVKIDFIADHRVFFDRRVFFADDRRRHSMLFHLQAFFRHLRAGRVARHAQGDLGFSLRDFAVHRQLDRTDFAVQIQRIIENNNRKFLLRAEMFDDRGNIVIRRIDFFGDVNHLTRQIALAIRNKGP